MIDTSQREKTSDLFRTLREQILDAFSALERELGNPANGPDSGSDSGPDSAPSGQTGQFGQFTRSAWRREAGGGGEAAIMRGSLFEKAGVHFSEVFGEITPDMATVLAKHDPDVASASGFWASGVSVIVHPYSPHIPSVHLNVRRIEASSSWYGGGADLTPMLAGRRDKADPDSKEFLAAMRRACEVGKADYESLHASCAEYFTVRHRGCERGIGGIFFDAHTGESENHSRSFCSAIVSEFLSSYTQIVRRNAALAVNEELLREQERTRALYAEFNLLYDRGTAFGLRSGGNIEAIMSSLPPRVRWD